MGALEFFALREITQKCGAGLTHFASTSDLAFRPGGAAVYAKVSRAAVYKRMKTGGLTAFCFHIIGKTKTIFGGERKLKEWPLCYIPSSECKAWGAELDERAARLEANRGTVEDEAALNEADVDEDSPNPDFIFYDPKDKKRRDIKYVATNDIEPPKEIADEL